MIVHFTHITRYCAQSFMFFVGLYLSAFWLSVLFNTIEVGSLCELKTVNVSTLISLLGVSDGLRI